MSHTAATETMLVTFRGVVFRLTFRLFPGQRRASCRVEVQDEDRWQELAGFDVREAASKWQRALDRAIEHAYRHGHAQGGDDAVTGAPAGE